MREELMLSKEEDAKNIVDKKEKLMSVILQELGVAISTYRTIAV